jgi:hypothetical protein
LILQSSKPHTTEVGLTGTFGSNILSPKGDNAMPGQKNPWKKAFRTTLWLAPTLGVSTAAVLLILFLIADPSHGQTVSDTQVTLSCNDGHSVTVAVDPSTLLELTAAVQALVNDPTGLSCTLDPAATPPTSWTVFDFNPSGQAIRPRVSADSMPATTSGDTTSFQFLSGIFTALLTTTDPSLTGDLSGKTLNVTASVTGGASTFKDQHSGGCPDNKSVRFFFTSPKASGTTGPGTTGFFTQFWWSNPMSVPLVTDPQGQMSISQPVNGLHMWSDFNGKFNDDSLEVMEAFQVAIHNVQSVGLSFGGGCFFENGVTTSDGQGVFNSTFTETETIP